MNKHGGSSPDVSTLSIPLKSSTASQTDLRGEVGISSSPCLKKQQSYLLFNFIIIFLERNLQLWLYNILANW